MRAVKTRPAEFVALVAFTTSLAAMSTDSMLPALGDIAAELGARAASDRQLVVTALFGGFTAAQPVYGPVSDATGRKPALYAGTALFIVGGTICAVARQFGWLLFGRVIQGVGAAGPRIISNAMVRDEFAGSAMARV